MIPDILIKQWQLFGWKDGIEITCFSVVFYYFSLWLKADKQKNLLLPFYGYFIAIGVAYTGNFATVYAFLLTYAPVALLLMIITHQETLQRNFITFKNITLALHNGSVNWLDVLIRCSLHSMNKNKPLLYVIEQEDSLKNYFNTIFYLYTQVHHTIINMLIESPSFEHDKIMWITNQGTINAINCSWNNKNEHVMFQSTTQDLETWKQEALLFTAKTDAIVLYCCPKTRSFTILAQAKLVENVSAVSSLRILKQYVKKAHIDKKGPVYEPLAQKPTPDQLQS